MGNDLNLIALLLSSGRIFTGQGIGYAHSWGMPGGPFAARSRCVLRVET